jgi:hypothetical protein
MLPEVNKQSSEKNSYRAMKERCRNKNYRAFHRYGGRGIKVCDRWLGRKGFQNFISDMGQKPTPMHTLDRIDNDGDYEPKNCRWATQKQQVRNSSRVKRININGVLKPLSEWCSINNVKPATAWTRILQQGWSEEDAVTITAKQPGRNYRFSSYK